MAPHDSGRSGFTLLEVLIVVALIGLIATLVLIGFQNYAGYQRYKQGVAEVFFTLNQARTDARSAVDDESQGIKFSTGSTTRFTGDTYSAVDPDNVVTDHPLVTIETELTGGTDEIVFDKLSGLPSATGTVVVSGVLFSASTTITVRETGIIE